MLLRHRLLNNTNNSKYVTTTTKTRINFLQEGWSDKLSEQSTSSLWCLHVNDLMTFMCYCVVTLYHTTQLAILYFHYIWRTHTWSIQHRFHQTHSSKHILWIYRVITWLSHDQTIYEAIITHTHKKQQHTYQASGCISFVFLMSLLNFHLERTYMDEIIGPSYVV